MISNKDGSITFGASPIRLPYLWDPKFIESGCLRTPGVTATWFDGETASSPDILTVCGGPGEYQYKLSKLVSTNPSLDRLEEESASTEEQFTSYEERAYPIEVWECRGLGESWDQVLVRAAVEEGRETGTSEVAGVKYTTHFLMDGFDRRWDFGSSDDTHVYAFIIAPDGSGRYYNFRGKSEARPSDVVNCRQIE